MHRAEVKAKNVLKEQNVRFRRAFEDPSFLYRVVFTVGLAAFVILLYLWCRLTVVNLGYEISQLNMEYRQALEENRRLKIEVAGLKSPKRIEPIAIKMGLQYPTKEQIIHLR